LTPSVYIFHLHCVQYISTEQHVLQHYALCNVYVLTVCLYQSVCLSVGCLMVVSSSTSTCSIQCWCATDCIHIPCRPGPPRVLHIFIQTQLAVEGLNVWCNHSVTAHKAATDYKPSYLKVTYSGGRHQWMPYSFVNNCLHC
jgi:hypothetical protein